MVYIYESHLGGLYVDTKELSLDERYCDQCGDCDGLVFQSDDIFEIAAFLRGENDLFNTADRYSYEYTTKIFKTCEELLKNESLEEDNDD